MKYRAISFVAAAALAALTVGAFPRTQQASAAEGSYYSSITASGGDALLGELHDLITTTHTTYVNYDASRDNAKITDPALNGEDGVVEFYTHETIRYYINDKPEGFSGDNGKWNREHVWPQANSNGKWGKEGGGADLHHLRPSEVKMNSDRGNKLYGEVSNGSPVYTQKLGGGNSKIGGYQSGGVFEPLDNVKGDAARIVLYVYTHYNTYSNVHGTTNGNGSSGYFGTLPITNIISASSEEAAFDLLVEWNKLDPVDEIETTRNEAAYRIQGNRNPFIDHPEYVSAIWGDGADTPVDPPVDPDDPDEPDTPDEPKGGTVTIGASSFEMQSAKYGFHPWSADGVEGIAFVYGGETSVMQFNKKKDSYYLASTTPTGGKISSVTVKLKEGETERPWKLLTSDTPYGEVAGKPTEGTDQGTKTVTAEGVTWEVTGDGTYFALTYELDRSSGACYLDSIVVEFASSTPADPDTPVDPDTSDTPVDPGDSDDPDIPSGEQKPSGGEENPSQGEQPSEGGENPSQGEQKPADGSTAAGDEGALGCGSVVSGMGGAALIAAFTPLLLVRRKKRK